MIMLLMSSFASSALCRLFAESAASTLPNAPDQNFLRKILAAPRMGEERFISGKPNPKRESTI
jgi:hypothetical protein